MFVTDAGITTVSNFALLNVREPIVDTPAGTLNVPVNAAGIRCKVVCPYNFITIEPSTSLNIPAEWSVSAMWKASIRLRPSNAVVGMDSNVSGRVTLVR